MQFVLRRRLLGDIFRSVRLLSDVEKKKWVALAAGRTSMALADFAGVLLIALVVGMGSASLRGENSFEFGPFTFEVLGGEGVLLLFVLTAGVFLIKAILSWLLLRKTNHFLGSVEARLAGRVLRSIFDSNFEKIGDQSKGAIQFSVLQSVQVASSTMLMIAITILAEASVLLAVFLALFLADSSAALIVLGFFGLSALAYGLVFHRRLLESGELMARQFVSTSDLALDLLSVVREARVIGVFSALLSNLRVSRQAYAHNVAIQRTLLASPRLWSETSLYLGLGLFFSWAFVTEDYVELLGRGLLLLVAGVRIAGAFLPLQNAVAQLRNSLPQARRSLDFIENLRPSPESSEVGGHIFPAKPLGVSISNVSFIFSDSKTPLLNGVNLKIEPGQFVAMFGPSGSGKSTLVDILLGLNSPSSGVASIGGLDSSQIAKFRRGAIGYVPQQPGMIRGSIAENIALGLRQDEIDEDRILSVLKASHIKLNSLGKDQLWRPLGEQANKLSGGQALKIGLARALYWDPLFLVLDEPTSALDSKSEEEFRLAVGELKGRCTILMIAHRIQSARDADFAVFLDRGVVVSSGSVEKLSAEIQNSSQDELRGVSP